MTILPKALCRFNAINTKLPMAFLRELKQKNFTISMETPMTWIAKGIVRRKYVTGGIRLTDFNKFYKDTVRPIWHWPKNRNTNQCNRIEGSEISTHTYGYLTNDKGSKNTQWRKDSLFNKWCWKNWRTTWKRIKLYSILPYTKINSKWIKHLNVRLYII